jgi:hypothetical protein
MPEPHQATSRSPQATLREIARRLGRPAPSSRFLSALCPLHGDTSPSLSLWVGSGQLRARCFAGCSERAVLAALGCATPFAQSAPSDVEIEAEIAEAREAAKRAERALQIWKDALSLTEAGLAVRYLRKTRRLALPVLPRTLRLHPNLYHGWSRTSPPALIARVDVADGEMVAVHRIWLDPATADKAPIEPQRALLGSQQHGAVHLFDRPDSKELLVAEGVETALAAGELDHWKRSVWAALSTSGLVALQVPKKFGAVVIAADHDANGAGVYAANVLAHRLRKRGVRVRIVASRRVGADWNDELLENKQQGTAA